MNTVFVRSKRFERDECVAQWPRALTNLGHDNVIVEGDPGALQWPTVVDATTAGLGHAIGGDEDDALPVCR